MASTIKIKRSSVAGKRPTTSEITTGELALNTKDQKLFSSNGTSVFELASAGALANTNAYIATKANATNPTTSGLLAHTGRATISTNLAVSGNTILSGTLVANSSPGTAGYYLRTSGTGVYWSPVSASGGGANGFSGILVGANVISADSTTDRLTLVAGSGITLAANPTTDTITISSTASGAAANVVTKIVKDLTQNDTVVTSVSGVVVGSGITTGKAIAMAIVFGG